MKRLILLLVIALVLFAIMLTCGLTRDSHQDRASHPSWSGLLDPLSKKQALSVSDILATPCLSNGDLISRPSMNCSIHIRTSQHANVRTLKMAVLAGHSAKIDLQTHGQAGMHLEIPVRSSSSKSPEMQIPKEGAELTVVCEEPTPDPLSGSGVAQMPDCRLRISR